MEGYRVWNNVNVVRGIKLNLLIIPYLISRYYDYSPDFKGLSRKNPHWRRLGRG